MDNEAHKQATFLRMHDSCSKPWGAWAPPLASWPLRLLVKAGLSRGVVRRWIRKQWEKKYPARVDACIRGIRFRLDIARNMTDRQLLLSSVHHDREELRALARPVKQGAQGCVFVDLGANTGYYSLSMVRAGYARVLAIEPNPPTLELLKFNIAANHLENVIEVVPMCVGQGGQVPFYVDEHALGVASLLVERDRKVKPILVKSAPFLEILERNGVARIDGMKIDIEGYEDRALGPFFDTAPRSLWPRILVIEHCHHQVWETDIIGRMLSVGYTVRNKTRGNSILELN
ncbi:methyltransferase, FkbM family [Opitutaceae bacterium TAV1]|nr:methyltransferase, FkbM family [Opitutaceae bacterium TAV1]